MTSCNSISVSNSSCFHTATSSVILKISICFKTLQYSSQNVQTSLPHCRFQQHERKWSVKNPFSEEIISAQNRKCGRQNSTTQIREVAFLFWEMKCICPGTMCCIKSSPGWLVFKMKMLDMRWKHANRFNWYQCVGKLKIIFVHSQMHAI